MNTNTMNNNGRTIVIVNRNNTALIFNATNAKTTTVKADNTSMASITAVTSLLEKLDENATELTTIIVPRSLSVMLQITRPQAIKDNGYKSENGAKEYTKEYIDSLIYINQLRQYLGTKVVQFRISGSSILTKEQTVYVNQAWNALNNIEIPQQVQKQKPQSPQGIVQSIEVSCL